MNLNNWNCEVLNLVKVEMLRQACELTEDRVLLVDLSEAIDEIHQSFLEDNESSRLQVSLVLEYAQTNFETISYELPLHVSAHWRSASVLEKVLTLFSFYFATLRINRLVRVADQLSAVHGR